MRNIFLKTASALILTALLHTNAQAQCAAKGTGDINGIVNSFPATEHIAKAMNTCSGNGLTVTVKVTDKARVETEQAFAAANSPFHFAHVSNGVFVNLHALGQLQPITDLVNKYKAQFKLQDNMLVGFNGEVFGIAFMANTQHMFYRKDLLEKAGIAVPKTYDDVLAASAKLKAGGMEAPFSAAFKSGWDIATEFTNLYLGTGADFFVKSSAMPAINNAKGEQTLELMKKLSTVMSPNALALGTADVTTAFQQGQTAIANLWGSRASAIEDDKVSKVVGQVPFAASPSTVAGGKPAAAIWWDALVMPKNLTGANREAAFLVMMHGLSEETASAGSGLTTWLRSNTKPGRASEGVHASLAAGAANWPEQAYFSLLHGAIGKQVPDFISGKKTAKEALADAEKDYVQAAKDKGFIK